MAMLGTAASIQCNNYLLGYHSDLDLNAIPNGTLNYDVNFLNSDHGCDRFSSSADLHLEYNKEVLKQTMLKHEAIFKDQIYELHCLYKRQRELMDEIKTNSIEQDHLVLEKSHPNLVFSHTLSGYVPERHSFSWLNRVSTETSVSPLKNILAPSGSNGGGFKLADSNRARAEDYRVDSDLLESKCIKSRKILFDLELPADAYINIENESDDRVPEEVNYSTESVHGSGGLNSVSHGGGTASPHSLPRIINCVDLNKPIDVEVDSASGSDDFSGHTNSGCQAVSKNMTDAHTSSNLNFSLQGVTTGSVFTPSQSAHVQFNATLEPPSPISLDKTSGKSSSEKAKPDSKSSGINHELLEYSHLGFVGIFDRQSCQVVPHVDRTKSMPSFVSPWKYGMNDSGRNPIVVQALPCFTNSVKLAKSSKHSIVSTKLAGGRIQHINSSPSRKSTDFHQGGLRNGSQSDCGLASKQHSSPKYVKGTKLPYAKSTKYLNLNQILDSCSPDVAVSHDVSGKQVSEYSGIEMGLKNNLSVCRDHIDLNSCINEDESSTISNSLTNLEAPVIPEKEWSPFRGKEGNVEQELARSAAEAIVFISASVAESCQEKAAASSLSEVGSLHWFAGIVVSSQAENCRDYKMCPSDEIDYFEAMTLELTESSDQKQEITRVKPLPNQVERGRTRRLQPKDFQNEVLPGVASLSRNEVSKDLHTIGELIESAHACGTRNSRSRGKRGSSSTPCSEGVIRSTQKVKTSDSKMGFERGLIGWGKITRGPRKHRLPPTKPLQVHTEL